jgi:hypothetical protein
LPPEHYFKMDGNIDTKLPSCCLIAYRGVSAEQRFDLISRKERRNQELNETNMLPLNDDELMY